MAPSPKSTTDSRSPSAPALLLEDLRTPWFERAIDDGRALPGLCNLRGSIQMAPDPTGFRHPIFPPYCGAEETTGVEVEGDNGPVIRPGLETLQQTSRLRNLPVAGVLYDVENGGITQARGDHAC